MSSQPPQAIFMTTGGVTTNNMKDINIEKMIEPFDIKDFDIANIELPERLRTPDALIQRLNRVAEERASDGLHSDLTAEEGLFSNSNAGHRDLYPVGRGKTSSSLWSIVARAYADVRSDRSIDYVVADPESNLLFLQRCWELGAPASPFDLNWILMNARKDGKLGDLSRPKRFSIPKAQLDKYSFAVEIAMRAVQERLYYSEQRDVSIDQVLCDPSLAKEFDAYAKRIVPEQTSLDCRWATMALRKARRPCPASFCLPSFQALGLVEDVRISQLTASSGTYWVRSADDSLFAGVATNLRVQIDQLIQRIGHTIVPPWLPEKPKVKPDIMFSLAGSYGDAEIVRAGVFKQAGSRLNFWNGSFFGSAA